MVCQQSIADQSDQHLLVRLAPQIADGRDVLRRVKHINSTASAIESAGNAYRLEKLVLSAVSRECNIL